MTKRKHVNAIFSFNENVSQFLTDTATVYTAVTTTPGSTYISVPAATMTAMQARLTAARNAESAAATGMMGLAAARNLAVGAVETDVRNLVTLIQVAANNAPDVATATAIITEYGLVTRRTYSRVKPEFAVVNDPTSVGVVDISFKAAANRDAACYETQTSTDNVNWTTVKISPTGNYTYIHGLVSGTKLYFRGRVILTDKKGGAQSWLTPSAAFIFVP